MADYAILQEINKCMKCRGCQVACKRGQGILNVDPDYTAEKIQYDNPMVMKNQGKNYDPPFVRYSCWHCTNPPCASACPRGAMKVSAVNGGVYVDKTLCTPDTNGCTRQCITNCRKGGYPRVGTNTPGKFAYKCDLCYDRLSPLTGKPICVTACPGKALKYDTVDNIKAQLARNDITGYGQTGDVWVGEGHIFWARKNKNGALATFNPPTADPYIEDHISPMFNKLLKSPVTTALALPALAFGGLLAFFKRRETLSEVEDT
jgi:Fe-S-cluster-containing dehydrogenase component